MVAGEGSTPEPIAPPFHESTLDQNKTPASDEEEPKKNGSSSGRSRTLRRLVMIGAPLAVLLAIYLIIQLVLDQPSQPENTTPQSSATNEFKEEAPWRLVIRNDGSSNGCTLTLINSDTRETWTNPYAVHDTASFLIPQGGTFRWSVESGCTVVSRPGPGSLTLPAVVDGVGTSDAFEPPAVITVSVKDFHGNQRCALELRDVVRGNSRGHWRAERAARQRDATAEGSETGLSQQRRMRRRGLARLARSKLTLHRGRSTRGRDGRQRAHAPKETRLP